MAATYILGPFRLDAETDTLFRGGEPVSLGHRAVALLRVLVEQPGIPVSKDALMEAAWAGLTVEESNLAVQIAALRRVFGEEPGGENWIETFPRRGYRFVGPASTQDKGVVTAASQAANFPMAAGSSNPTLPDRPSIAVLPFANISADPEQEYFADGMVEEIITALSRIRWLFVIARNSTFTYKGQSIDVKRVGRELGVRYVLEGSVRKAGGRVRITAQLIDAINGAHLWADRFDGSLEDVFELQDKVAVSVAGVIEPTLQAAEMRRSAARPTTDLGAYDLYLRALAAFYPTTRERILKALDLLEQAIAIDPHYGPALAWTAMCHMRLVLDGWAEEPETNRRKAIELARQALQVEREDPGVLVHGAFTLAYFGEDIGVMLGLIDRALALNPSYARGWYVSGLLRSFAGEHDLAIEHVESSLRLSPRERMGAPLVVIGVAYFFKRLFDEAVPKLLLSIQDQPGYPASYRYLAACHAHTGRLDEARAVLARLRAITPQVMPIVLPFRNPEDRELLLSGLRLAAGEET